MTHRWHRTWMPGRPWRLHLGKSRFVASPRIGHTSLAVRIGQLTAEVFHLLDLRPCWPLPDLHLLSFRQRYWRTLFRVKRAVTWLSDFEVGPTLRHATMGAKCQNRLSSCARGESSWRCTPRQPLPWSRISESVFGPMPRIAA